MVVSTLLCHIECSVVRYCNTITLQNRIQRYYKKCATSRPLNELKKFENRNLPEVRQELLEPDKEYQTILNNSLGYNNLFHTCYVVHPYVKWGPKKQRDTNSENQIREAVSLIETLAPWQVYDTIAVPLTDLNKKSLFGYGTLQKLKNEISRNSNITAVFVNLSMLKNIQLKELELEFGVSIFDRYKIVMQILRRHAISTHAKLQVALAELPYLRMRLLHEDFKIVTSDDYETRKLVLQNREQTLKLALKKVQSQRQLLRKRRKEKEYPVIAIVGYTNVGKTSLIKALTDSNLQPINRLFATLDVTMHAGRLPSTLKVLYVDTVGFISNIPTSLIECFVVTLEDAMVADIIVHVEDLSNSDLIHQRNHVLSTLQDLSVKVGSPELFKKIITVGNKYDLVPNAVLSRNYIAVSSMTYQGIDELRIALDQAVLKATQRIAMKFNVSSGGDEMRWLYKNAAVYSITESVGHSDCQTMQVVITENKLQQFKHSFVRNKK